MTQPMLQAMAGIAHQITEGYGQPSSVVDMLRAINAEQRAEIERLEGMVKNRETELLVMNHEVAKRQRRLDFLEGKHAKPEDGGLLVELEITPSLSLTVDCEYEPETLPRWDDPGDPGICEAWSVMIQGRWVLIPELIQRLNDEAAIHDAAKAAYQAAIDEATKG
jgi:hypothetical protein